MEKSKVYFTDFRASFSENLPMKLARLIKTAGLSDIPMKDKFVAIKIHFGEPGNLAYLRPNYAKVVADYVKKEGGRPFLTDSNTLYVGRRKNAIDHLEAAYENGFNPFATGCHVLIADGLKGTDEALVPIDGEYIKEAKIGRAVMDADVFISLTHFKMHEAAGIGGALKNIGMGCGSRAGKMEMHAATHPVVSPDKCISCGACKKNCAHDAITFRDKKAFVMEDKCVGCGRCIGVCPTDAVESSWDEANDVLGKKISEYSLAVLKGRPHFHIALITDVSPYCDCHGENDSPIIPDVGMLASFDPVALDTACAELVNAQKPMPNSLLSEKEAGKDYFSTIHPTTHWRAGVEHAEKIGLGSMDYELVKMV